MWQYELLVAGVREELNVRNDHESKTKHVGDEDWAETDRLLEDGE